MIDDVYKTLLTLLNKENLGHITPERFNELASDVQQEIFRNYFEDENRDKLRKRKHLLSVGYGNLDFNERQKITQFSVNTTVTQVGGVYPLPSDVYFLEDEGVLDSTGMVIDEVEHNRVGYLNRSLAAPSTIFPIYEKEGNNLKVYPSTITDDITIKYIRQPKPPKWTYVVIANNELYDPTNPSFQDFELHPSEFNNILMRLLSRCGVVLRESEVVKVAENTLQKINIKDNS